MVLLSNPFLQLAAVFPPKAAAAKPNTNNSSMFTVRALKQVHGTVVCNTNDKTVNVRVIRYTVHPKYKTRVRKVNKLQAHDPDNVFKVGDLVTLQKCRPISKTKHHMAVPYVDPHRRDQEDDPLPPLQSDQ